MSTDTAVLQALNPATWARPKGYSNAVMGEGRWLFIAGQIGWDPANERIVGDDFIAQVEQALQNTVDLLAEAGAGPQHLARMTWYVTDKREYVDNLAKVGGAYRRIIGKSFPAMTLIEVRGLVEDSAKVEIESTALVP